MTRRRSLRCLGLAVALLLVPAHGRVQAVAPQDWRVTSLAAFDLVWQTIMDTYYDPTFGGVDWVGARGELRPRAERAETPDDVRQVIRALLARLGRSHFQLISSAPGDALTGEAVAPIEIRVIDRELVVTRVEAAAAQAGVRAGDVLLGVDQQAASAWWAGTPADDARTAALEAWRRASRALHGAPRSGAALRLTSPGTDARVVTVTRTLEAGDIVTLGNLPPMRVRVDTREVTTDAGRRVGVIAFNIWMTTIDAPVAQAIDRFRLAPGLVLDLRGNPGGLADMIRGISGHLIDEPSLLGRMRMRAVVRPLEFRVNPRRATDDGRAVTPFAGPVAILVDELTASASECFTGALQSLGRVRVFGRQTMGQALPAATRTLPTGDVLMHAVGDFVTASGRSLEGDGVQPDVVVPLVRADLAAGRDAVLLAALRWLDTR